MWSRSASVRFPKPNCTDKRLLLPGSVWYNGDRMGALHNMRATCQSCCDHSHGNGASAGYSDDLPTLLNCFQGFIDTSAFCEDFNVKG